MGLDKKDIERVNNTIQEKFNGDKDLFFNDFKKKIIFVMVFMAISFAYSILIFKTGHIPIFTPILGIALLIFSLSLVKVYNKLHDSLY